MRKSEFIDKDLLKEKEKSDIKSDWLIRFMEEGTDNKGEIESVKNQAKVIEHRADLQHNPDLHSLSKGDLMVERALKFRQYHQQFNMGIDRNYLK